MENINSIDSDIIQLGNMIIWYRNYKRKEADLTSSQGDVLRYILEYETPDTHITSVQLMENLQLGQSTISGIILRLQKKGLVKKEVDKADARRVYITSTQKGRELGQYLKKSADELQEIIFKNISPEDVDGFIKKLRIMLDNLNHIRNEDK